MDRRRWLILGLLTCLTLGTAAGWWLSRGSSESAKRDSEDTALRAPRSFGDPRLGEVARLARDKSDEGRKKLIESYARWAGDPSAEPARKLVLGALFAEPQLGRKLKGVLEAVAADPNPPDRDPLWSRVTEGLADLWTPETFDKARDLMLMETRPRARQALIDSWSRVVDSEALAQLSEEQRRQLTNDLVDLYPGAEPEQKPTIEGTLRVLAGNDLAEVISGRGLQPGASLETEQRQRREVEEAMAKLPADSEAVEQVREPEL